MCHENEHFQLRVAGNIARDNAKNLRIEEYNALFGVSEAAESNAEVARRNAMAARDRQLLARMMAKEKAKAKKAGCYSWCHDSESGGDEDY